MIENVVVLIALFCLLFAILNLIGSFVVSLADMEVDQSIGIVLFMLQSLLSP